jgi:hypothetical protein
MESKIHYSVHKSPPTSPYPVPDESNPYNPIIYL